MNKPARDESCKLTVQNGFDGVRSLVYMPTKKKTLSHSEYSYGWRMYKSVYLESHPNEVHGMLAFENDICNFARQGLDWIRYDEAFSKGKEMHSYPWKAMYPDLDRILYANVRSTDMNLFRHSQSNFRGSRFRPFQISFHDNGRDQMLPIPGYGEPNGARGERGTYIPKGYCYQFHTRVERCLFGQGECKYDHRCFRCFEQHAIYNCTKKSPDSSKMPNTTPTSNTS